MAGAVPAGARWSARALRGAGGGGGAGAGAAAGEEAAGLAGLAPPAGGAARVAEGLAWAGAVARARVPPGTPPLWAVQSRAGWGALARAPAGAAPGAAGGGREPPRAPPPAPPAPAPILGAEAVVRLAPRSVGGLLVVPKPRAERPGKP